MSKTRNRHLAFSPAPNDLTLAEISFHGSWPGVRISTRALRLSVLGSFGDDYLAVGAVGRREASGPRALVLIVNRPSPLLDPARVRLLLRTPVSLGRPVVRVLSDPFTRPGGSSPPALCNLRLHGAALSASELLTLHTRGQALAGFDAASALAQAYDVVCELPHASSFEQAVERSAPSTPAPVAPEPPITTPTPTVPTPVPPVGKLPGEGCEPKPGYACPAGVGRAAVAPSR